MAAAKLIVDVLSSKMGSDILLLDLTDVAIISDYFVIATGESDRQLQAMADATLEQIKSTGHRDPLSVEGAPESGWVLIDLGSIVVHLFSAKQRDRYRLEELWRHARTVLRMA